MVCNEKAKRLNQKELSKWVYVKYVRTRFNLMIPFLKTGTLFFVGKNENCFGALRLEE